MEKAQESRLLRAEAPATRRLACELIEDRHRLKLGCRYKDTYLRSHVHVLGIELTCFSCIPYRRRLRYLGRRRLEGRRWFAIYRQKKVHQGGDLKGHTKQNITPRVNGKGFLLS